MELLDKRWPRAGLADLPGSVARTLLVGVLADPTTRFLLSAVQLGEPTGALGCLSYRSDLLVDP